MAEAGVPVVGRTDTVAADLGSNRVGVLAPSAPAPSGPHSRAIHASTTHPQVIAIPSPTLLLL